MLVACKFDPADGILGAMAFALWFEGDLAIAQGTHEYRPMGWAVIARTAVFSPRDFRPQPLMRRRTDRGFAGLFASLSELNAFLVKSRSQPKRKKRRQPTTHLIAIL